MIVIITQLGDVNQTLHIIIIELDKQAKTGHRSYRAVKFVTDTVLHVLAFQPVSNAVTGSIRPPLS